MNAYSQKKPLVKWTLLVVFFPLVAFLSVDRWEKYHKQLPLFATIVPTTGDPYNTPLADQDGRTVLLPGFRGKILVAHFFFSRCPASCPKMMQHMRLLQQTFGEDPRLELLSLTVDPGYDTPPVLANYARKYGVDSTSWLLLTGDKKQLYRIARTDLHVTASDGDGGPEDFIHSDQMVLVDPKGNIRGYYTGTADREVNKLINDIKILQHEF